MKFRIKFKNKTFQVMLNDDNNITLGRLKDESASVLEREFGFVPRSFDLSLNGKDALDELDKSLAHFGIVCGDLLHIISNEDVILISPQSSQAPLFANTPAPESIQTTDMILEMNPADTSSDPAPTTQAQNENSSEMTEEDHLNEVLINKYLSEPMLCRDSTSTRVPESLQQLYVHTDVQNISDAMCVALHVLMLETGFREHNSISSVEAASVSDPVTQNPNPSMPRDWRRVGIYTFKYSHPSCLSLSCSVVCVPLAKQIMVHGYVDKGERSSKVQLLLKSEYYVNNIFQKDAAQVYRNLPKLSHLFKDAISYPLLVNMQNAAGLLPQYGIMTLSLEIKLYLFKFLDARSLLNLTEVCKEFNLLAKESVLWKNIYFRDFRDKYQKSNSIDWLQLYKAKYLERKRFQDARRLMQYVPPHRFPNHRQPPLPFSPYSPGVIGGDYDLYPAFSGAPNPFAPAFPNIQPPNLFRPPRPRFDPFGPLPEQHFRPGRPSSHFPLERSNFGFL